MKLQPGGTQGGELKFLFGAVLAAVGLYLFFDSVRFTTGHFGVISGAFHGRGGGGGRFGETTSMGIVLVPLFVGIAALFFDARRTWAWVITWIGVAILLIEIVSRMRPYLDSKASHIILMMIMIAGGFGLMLRAYVEDRNRKKGTGDDEGE